MMAPRPFPGQKARSTELRDALRMCWSAFAGVAVLSGVINILYLTG